MRLTLHIIRKKLSLWRMNRTCESCELSNVAKEYLSAYKNILEEMKCGMSEVKLTTSISDNFIEQMIPHHRGAIEMSKNLLRYTTCIPLQEIAIGILEEQTRNIEQMRAIQNMCGKRRNPGEEVCHFRQRMDRVMKVMFAEMGSACATNRINEDFMREMIPHHKGAVEMSKIALQYNICADLVPLLKGIISSQEKGIRQMQCLSEQIKGKA